MAKKPKTLRRDSSSQKPTPEDRSVAQTATPEDRSFARASGSQEPAPDEQAGARASGRQFLPDDLPFDLPFLSPLEALLPEEPVAMEVGAEAHCAAATRFEVSLRGASYWANVQSTDSPTKRLLCKSLASIIGPLWVNLTSLHNHVNVMFEVVLVWVRETLWPFLRRGFANSGQQEQFRQTRDICDRFATDMEHILTRLDAQDRRLCQVGDRMRTIEADVLRLRQQIAGIAPAGDRKEQGQCTPRSARSVEPARSHHSAESIAESIRAAQAEAHQARGVNSLLVCADMSGSGLSRSAPASMSGE